MNVHDVNPYIRVAMPSRLPPDYQIKERVIFDYELIYVEDGNFSFSYAGKPYLCRQGAFIFIRPGIPHSFLTAKEGVSQPHIHFDICYAADSKDVFVSFKNFPDLSPAEKKLIRKDVFAEYPKSPFVHFEDAAQLLPLFYEIVDPHTPLHTLRKKALMTEILNRLILDNFPACFSEEIAPVSPAAQLKNYIDAGQGLSSSLDDFANQFSYSKFYLEKQFKQLFGIPIIAYQTQKRMEVAKGMLETTSITNTAKELGFSSIHTFSRAFKAYWGCTPSQYRK